MTENDFHSSVKEMTQYIFHQWFENIHKIRNHEQNEDIIYINDDNHYSYNEYLQLFENLSSQIRTRQIIPLAQYMLYMLDKAKIAPTWIIYNNIYFAFEQTSDIYQRGEQIFSKSETINSTILKNKRYELQDKYICENHIKYLLNNRKYEQSILMMNIFHSHFNHPYFDSLKLLCIEKYILNKEIFSITMDDNNSLTFNNNYPSIININENNEEFYYFVENRINNHSPNHQQLIYNNKQQMNINIDQNKDMILYIPCSIMQEYKAQIHMFCMDEILIKRPHLQLEILSNLEQQNTKQLKKKYDTWIIRNCKSIHEKLNIFQYIINDFFTNILHIVQVVDTIFELNSKIYMKQMNKKFEFQSFLNKLQKTYQCLIDIHSISSFSFDQIPMFFIWMNNRTPQNNIEQCAQHLQQYLEQRKMSDKKLLSSINQRNNETLYYLSIDISDKHFSRIWSVFQNNDQFLKKELKHFRDRKYWKYMDMNVQWKKNKNEGGILSMMAPKRNLRKKMYQQILYKYPPKNNEHLFISEVDIFSSQNEKKWKNIHLLLTEIVCNISGDNAFEQNISNAYYIARLHEKYQQESYEEWMKLLFKQIDENSDILKNISIEYFLPKYKLLINILCLKINTNENIISHLFYNIWTNDTFMMDNIHDYHSMCEMYFSTIIALCNHGINGGNICLMDFHRIRAAFLHFCNLMFAEEESEMVQHLLHTLSSTHKYLMVMLEYIYQACKLKNANLCQNILQFLNEILILVQDGSVEGNETYVGQYKIFVESSFDLVMDELPDAQLFLTHNFKQFLLRFLSNNEYDNHLFESLDMESLKISLNSEEFRNEIEKYSFSILENLYKYCLMEFSVVGNVECVKFLMNKLQYSANRMRMDKEMDEYCFGINDDFLKIICDNIWNYYRIDVGYDDEICAYYLLQMLECVLNDRNIWRSIVSEDTVTHFAIILADHRLLTQMKSLENYIVLDAIGNEDDTQFATLGALLTQIDYTSFDQNKYSMYIKMKYY